MRDTILLYNIYRKYLLATADLIELLERHEKWGTSPTLKVKYAEFSTHAHELIVSFNEDLHKLLRINAELKELENGKQKN